MKKSSITTFDMDECIANNTVHFINAALQCYGIEDYNTITKIQFTDVNKEVVNKFYLRHGLPDELYLFEYKIKCVKTAVEIEYYAPKEIISLFSENL
jgi:hypothetical protein